MSYKGRGFCRNL